MYSSLNASGEGEGESAESDGTFSSEISSPCSSALSSRSWIVKDLLGKGKGYNIDGEGGGMVPNNGPTTPLLSSLRNFKIIDSTLREGEQFATAYFSTAQKLKIAQALDEIGVEYVGIFANAYCALEAGATHIDTTVLGIGERNGITSFGGLLACLSTAERKYIRNKYRVDKLGYIEKFVAEAVEVEIPFNDCKVPWGPEPEEEEVKGF